MSTSVKESVPKGKIKVENFFEFPLKCFKFVGLVLIPSTDFSSRVQIRDKILKAFYFFCIINIWLFVLTLACRVIVSISDIPVVIRVLPNLTNVPYNSSKSLLLFMKRKTLLKILSDLRDNFPVSKFTQEKFNIQHKLKEFIRNNKLFGISYFFLISSVSVGSGYHLIVNGYRKQLCEIWFPFDDTGNDFAFITTSFWIMWMGTSICIILASADFITFGLVLVLSLEFEVLSDDIKTAIAEGNGRKLRNMFIRHQKLMDIYNQLDRLFRFYIFYTFFQGAVAVSTSGFQLLISSDIFEMTYCASYSGGSISQIFLYCYYGEKLMKSSIEVSKCIADSNWYDLKDNKLKMDLKFMMFRAQKPCALSAYRIATLSMETFSAVLTTSYSYFTLLKNMYFN